MASSAVPCCTLPNGNSFQELGLYRTLLYIEVRLFLRGAIATAKTTMLTFRAHNGISIPEHAVYFGDGTKDAVQWHYTLTSRNHPMRFFRQTNAGFRPPEELRSTAYEKLLPPLVAKIRVEVAAWRDTGYAGASDTSSRALLNWWFETEHLVERADGTLSPFRYYFAQREAVETVVWLHDVRKVRDKFDLMRFDASGAVSAGMFDEAWPRYVLKIATGAGKTKVLSLLIAWSYFHKLYEPDSTLARNFLLIAPNIIVLDRLRADFDGLRIFFNDPILPDNGHAGHNWRDDFQMTLHIQDDVRVQRRPAISS